MLVAHAALLSNEFLYLGSLATSPPVHGRFHTVPSSWNGPTLYVREHCTKKRRHMKGMGASQGAYCRREAKDGARATVEAQPPVLARAMFDVFTLIVAEKDYLRCFAHSHGGTGCQWGRA